LGISKQKPAGLTAGFCFDYPPVLSGESRKKY
jgi:hypothetical protein